MTKYVNPASTVDLIVPYENGILGIERGKSPFKGKKAFPGGFAETGKETLEQAACRELFEETGLIAVPEDLILLGVYSDPHRDPRGHVISHVYVVLRHRGKLRPGDDAAKLTTIIGVPEDLAFDHSKILREYYKKRELGVLG